jgi:hypothetical protein
VKPTEGNSYISLKIKRNLTQTTTTTKQKGRERSYKKKKKSLLLLLFYFLFQPSGTRDNHNIGQLKSTFSFRLSLIKRNGILSPLWVVVVVLYTHTHIHTHTVALSLSPAAVVVSVCRARC